MENFILNGGNSDSNYNQIVVGGKANSLYNDLLFGGSSYNISSNEKDIVFFMNLKLNQTGCWSVFNDKYKYYRFLVNHSMIGVFYKPENLPMQPKPDENSILEC